LGIDYGERRIGLAVSDPTGTIATPVGHLVRRAGKRAPVAALVRRATELGATGFVLGLPLDAEGGEPARAVEVRVVGAELAKRTGYPVRYVDERFTTRSPCAPSAPSAARRGGAKGMWMRWPQPCCCSMRWRCQADGRQASGERRR